MKHYNQNGTFALELADILQKGIDGYLRSIISLIRFRKKQYWIYAIVAQKN